jgi:hypothetical protein
MNLKVISATVVALTLVACSTQPTEPVAKAPAAAPAPAATPAAATSAAAPAAAVAPGANSGNLPVLNRTLISAGYKATTIKGQVYYCRQEDVIGTGFKRKVCLNEDQLKDEEIKIKQMQDQILRSQASPACSPMPGCAG